MIESDVSVSYTSQASTDSVCFELQSSIVYTLTKVLASLSYGMDLWNWETFEKLAAITFGNIKH